MQTMLPLIQCLGIGYLLGSIPFGLILTRAAGLGDVRNIGSGNIGATNVLRTGNKGLAAATLVLDCLKATAAIWLAQRWLTPDLRAMAVPASGGAASPAVLMAMVTLVQSYGWFAGLGAVLGHMFPVWLGFKGGKGVATFIGALLGAHWPAALLFAAIWAAVAAAFRYSSAAALTATVGVLGYFGWSEPRSIVTVVVAVMSVLIFWKHRENITRLLAGAESKIGQKGSAAS